VSPATDELVLRLAREKGLLSAADLSAAEMSVTTESLHAATPSQILVALAQQGAWDAGRSLRLLANAFALPIVDLDRLPRSEEAAALIPREMAARNGLVPFALRGSTLDVAVSDPLATDVVDRLAYSLHLKIETYLAPADALARALAHVYGEEKSSLDVMLADLSANPTDTEVNANVTDGTDAKADAPVIKLVHSMIAEAIRKRASDIHVEPFANRVRVRFRVDGTLLEREALPKHVQRAVVSRLKIMANISIAEKRIPGDGRMAFKLADRALDLRVSTVPTVHGESVVMRILDQESLKLGLAELGFLPDDQQTFEQLITLPDGIVLVTGPTGSGKTTTLYGCLHHLNHPDRKIITVEDPVEYQLTGINQVPVRHEVGMTFASALRAMLRQAPNVVMVGEIRDSETADIAINAALTGHTVFSTLHTNDATGAVTRLIDIGVKPFLISAAVRAVVAQRLVRKICEKCRRPAAPGSVQYHLLKQEHPADDGAGLMEGAGCNACQGTGFRGRIGIFELFVVEEEIQRMIYECQRPAFIRQRARAKGMRTLREDGIRKAKAGLTTVEEVVSLTVGEAS
jgi:general secretion pathway protein E/type IV pilus assembly protein PilB